METNIFALKKNLKKSKKKFSVILIFKENIIIMSVRLVSYHKVP